MDGRYQTTSDTSPRTPSPSTFQPHFNRRSFPLNTQDTAPTHINPQMSDTRHTRCRSEHNSKVTSLTSPTHTCKNIKRATSNPQPACITVATQNAARSVACYNRGMIKGQPPQREGTAAAGCWAGVWGRLQTCMCVLYRARFHMSPWVGAQFC